MIGASSYVVCSVVAVVANVIVEWTLPESQLGKASAWLQGPPSTAGRRGWPGINRENGRGSRYRS